MITSSADASLQPSYIFLPPKISKKKIPLVVFLHTWSNDLEQRFQNLENEVVKRGWLMIEPNFRGRNDHPEACGSILAQKDVLDAVEWMNEHYKIDRHRIYLVGFSGGGYFTMLMTAVYPKVWAAASAWCGISDLTEWYGLHEKDHYGEMMRKVFGGPPSSSDSIAAEYMKRSPLPNLVKKMPVPLDIAAGRDDAIVPPIHSIKAYNALAKANDHPIISQEEIEKFLHSDSVKAWSYTSNTITDSTLGRRILFRRQQENYRITIFDGEHEWIPAAAMEWLEGYRRKKKRS